MNSKALDNLVQAGTLKSESQPTRRNLTASWHRYIALQEPLAGLDVASSDPGEMRTMPEHHVNVRYMVDDVQSSIDWYTKNLGFKLLSSAVPAFADVERGLLRLLLSGEKSSAGRPMPDGSKPGPGGWNRIELVVSDLAAEVERLRARGLKFRNNIVTGPGGSQILLEDPSGNLVELFQPASQQSGKP